MNDRVLKAKELLTEFKGETYAFGISVLDKVGEYASSLGKNVLLVANESDWFEPYLKKIIDSLKSKGLSLCGDMVVPGAAPNAPREDVYRIETYILHYKPDCIVVAGGGSSIDAVKAANVLATLGKYDADIERYFGTGQVTQALNETGEKLIPLVAVETASSSGAHLTKYSNVTDLVSGQKKLIVDEAIVPDRAVFDYSVTKSMPAGLTADGALDGIAHCLEVFYGASSDRFEKLKEVCLTGIELIVENVVKCIEEPQSNDAREAVGLGTDLGGYAIMIGGTNGGHLTSFSLVDVTSHGRACALMNPYYTVFFAPAIQEQLRLVGEIYKRAGFIGENLHALSGRELGVAVAKGMINLSHELKFPTTISALDGFSDEHIKRAVNAAKNPQLEMKLKNMPIPLNASLIDEYMLPILEAAKTGDFGLIKTLE